MVDEDAVRQFVANVGPTVANTLVLLFVGEARARVARMEDLARRKDWKAVAREAHALKSTSRTYGIPALGDLVGQLEEACGANDATATALLSEVSTKAPAALDSLGALVEKLGRDPRA